MAVVSDDHKWRVRVFEDRCLVYLKEGQLNMRISSWSSLLWPSVCLTPQPVLCKCSHGTRFSPLPPVTWSGVSLQRADHNYRSYYLLHCDDSNFPPSSADASLGS